MPSKDTGSDWTLLMRCALSGDERAYEELLSDLTRFLRTFLARWFARLEEREEVTQDILLSLHVARNSFDTTKDFAPWFLTIARGRAIDAIRRKARIKEIAMESAGAEKTEWALQSEGLSSELMNGLSERDRDILKRVYLDGEAEVQVAMSYGVTMGNFRVLTHRLRRRVKQLLEDGGS